MLIFSLLILQVVLTIPFLFLGMPRHPVAMSLPTLIGTAVAIVYGYSRNSSKTGAKFTDIFPFSPVSARVLLAIFLAVVGLLILNLAATGLVMRIIPPPKLFSEFIRQALRGQQPFEIFLTVAIILPLGEEFLFRGLILHGFLSRYSTKKAIFASALLFALMHGNPWQLITGIIMGMFLAWCFVKTRSLIPCFWGHIANNSIAALLSRLQSQLPGATKWMALHIVWVDIAGLVLAVSGIYLLKSYSDAQAGMSNGIIPAINQADSSRQADIPEDAKENT